MLQHRHWLRSEGRPASGCEPRASRRHHHGTLEERQRHGWRAVHQEAEIGEAKWQAEQRWALEMGLAGAESLTDRTIPTFSRGELPHYAGINTFLKAPYVENVRDVGKFDAAVLGAPFDGGTTYRPGTRFGPQAMRRISALYTPYNFELGVDLREQMTLCDAGDVFTIPANIEKTFDQISRAVAHVTSSGALPIILGGDHSIGFPCVRGIAQCTSKRIGIVHFDRHADIQEKDLDERMHTTPWFHATDLPNVPATNLVQVGIGGWQVPRAAVQVARERNTTILTMRDVEELGIDKTAEIALEMAWKDADAVYLSFDIDSVDCGFVPGTGWPEPGGFLPREALALVGKVAAEGICGLEVVEVSPPYDTSDITALLATRVIVDVLGTLVAFGKLGAHKAIIDKPVAF
jgi:agmatinase